MLLNKIIFSTLFLLSVPVFANHFRGGIISWRPLETRPNGSTIEVQLHQRYFWNRLWGSFSTVCTEADVVALTPIPVGSYVKCYVNCASSTFPGGGVSTVMTTTDCDQNALIESWAGEHYDILTLPLTTSITISFNSSAWFGPNLYPAAGLGWAVVNTIDLSLRPDGIINTSPVTNTLPVLYKPVGQQLVHVVQMADNDGNDILRCRWSSPNASTNYNHLDECSGACGGLQNISTLFGDNCTLVFTLPVAKSGWYFVIALQIEDYFNASSPSPMSSVPIQFLFYAYTPSGSCTTRPEIIGERPNRACIGTPINVSLTDRVIAQSYCSGASIVNFVTSSPYGVQHSAIVNQGGGIYVMTLTWTPVQEQYGPQTFCAGAVDSNNLQSDAWCVTYLVGFRSPDLIQTQFVQGSASPIGTVFSNQSIFSIQASRPVNRPTRNGTYIRFIDASTNTSVQKFDAGWEPNILYTADTIVIITNYTWIPGNIYYVLFDSGVASGIEFCGPESAAVTDPRFWPFNIWDPGLSSTTTTTTTPPTTGTVTTRPLATTTPNASLTTTGVIASSPTTMTTTTLASSSSTPGNSTTVNSIVTAVTDIPIIYPTTFEEACKQPVAITTAVLSIIMGIIHVIGMFTLFTQMNKKFNPNHIAPVLRHQKHLKKQR